MHVCVQLCCRKPWYFGRPQITDQLSDTYCAVYMSSNFKRHKCWATSEHAWSEESAYWPGRQS